MYLAVRRPQWLIVPLNCGVTSCCFVEGEFKLPFSQWAPLFTTKFALAIFIFGGCLRNFCLLFKRLTAYSSLDLFHL